MEVVLVGTVVVVGGKIIPFIPFEPYASVIRVLKIKIAELLVSNTEP